MLHSRHLQSTNSSPSLGSAPSTAGSSTSNKSNAVARVAAYKKVEYKNASKKGPALIVIHGEIKSNNARVAQRFLPNKIADFGQPEL